MALRQGVIDELFCVRRMIKDHGNVDVLHPLPGDQVGLMGQIAWCCPQCQVDDHLIPGRFDCLQLCGSGLTRRAQISRHSQKIVDVGKLWCGHTRFPLVILLPVPWQSYYIERARQWLSTIAHLAEDIRLVPYPGL
jgi:hypothetical protein